MRLNVNKGPNHRHAAHSPPASIPHSRTIYSLRNHSRLRRRKEAASSSYKSPFTHHTRIAFLLISTSICLLLLLPYSVYASSLQEPHQEEEEDAVLSIPNESYLAYFTGNWMVVERDFPASLQSESGGARCKTALDCNGVAHGHCVYPTSNSATTDSIDPTTKQNHNQNQNQDQKQNIPGNSYEYEYEYSEAVGRPTPKANENDYGTGNGNGSNYGNETDGGHCVCKEGWSAPDCSHRLRSRKEAFVLSFLLGSWGADQFYLGNTGLGVGKLLVSFFLCVLPCCPMCCQCFMLSAETRQKVSYYVTVSTLIAGTGVIWGWWMFDWVQIMNGHMKDSGGYELIDDM
jgi:hypothetical protein